MLQAAITPQQERREFPRAVVRQSVTVATTTESPMKLTGISRNVSGNGIFLTIDDNERSLGYRSMAAGMYRRRPSPRSFGLMEGSEVVVIFSFPKTSGTGHYRVRGTGTIVRTEDLPDRQFGMAVAFDKLEVLTEA